MWPFPARPLASALPLRRMQARRDANKRLEHCAVYCVSTFRDGGLFPGLADLPLRSIVRNTALADFPLMTQYSAHRVTAPSPFLLPWARRGGEDVLRSKLRHARLQRMALLRSILRMVPASEGSSFTQYTAHQLPAFQPFPGQACHPLRRPGLPLLGPFSISGFPFWALPASPGFCFLFPLWLSPVRGGLLRFVCRLLFSPSRAPCRFVCLFLLAVPLPG